MDNKIYSLLEILSFNNENETIKNTYKVLNKNENQEIQIKDQIEKYKYIQIKV